MPDDCVAPKDLDAVEPKMMPYKRWRHEVAAHFNVQVDTVNDWLYRYGAPRPKLKRVNQRLFYVLNPIAAIRCLENWRPRKKKDAPICDLMRKRLKSRRWFWMAVSKCDSPVIRVEAHSQ